MRRQELYVICTKDPALGLTYYASLTADLSGFSGWVADKADATRMIRIAAHEITKEWKRIYNLPYRVRFAGFTK